MIKFSEVKVGDIIELRHGKTPMRFVNVQQIIVGKRTVKILDAVGETYTFLNNVKCIKHGECEVTRRTK